MCIAQPILCCTLAKRKLLSSTNTKDNQVNEYHFTLKLDLPNPKWDIEKVKMLKENVTRRIFFIHEQCSKNNMIVVKVYIFFT